MIPFYLKVSLYFFSSFLYIKYSNIQIYQYWLLFTRAIKNRLSSRTFQFYCLVCLHYLNFLFMFLTLYFPFPLFFSLIFIEIFVSHRTHIFLYNYKNQQIYLFISFFGACPFMAKLNQKWFFSQCYFLYFYIQSI